MEGLIHSGVTTEFLHQRLRARGAASVKVATLLDRQSARRVQLQPDYFGFLVDEAFLVGYGLGSPQQTQRNLPYVAVCKLKCNRDLSHDKNASRFSTIKSRIQHCWQVLYPNRFGGI